MKLRFAALALLFLVACGDDKKTPGIIVLPDTGVEDTGNDANANNTTTDMGETDAGPDVSTDTNVAMPGFLNGVWIVKVNDAAVATLTIRHEDGDTAATGTFNQVDPAAQGELNAVTWQDNVMTASWTIRVDNIPETFGVSEGASADANTINGRYTESATGTFANCRLERQP